MVNQYVEKDWQSQFPPSSHISRLLHLEYLVCSVTVCIVIYHTLLDN